MLAGSAQGHCRRSLTQYPEEWREAASPSWGDTPDPVHRTTGPGRSLSAPLRILAVAQKADLHQFQAQQLDLGQHPEQGSLISQRP